MFPATYLGMNWLIIGQRSLMICFPRQLMVWLIHNTPLIKSDLFKPFFQGPSGKFLNQIKGIDGFSSSLSTEGTPVGISDHVKTDPSLELSVDNNTLSGSVTIDCSAVSPQFCSKRIAEMHGINKSSGGYEVSLDIKAKVNSWDRSDFKLEYNDDYSSGHYDEGRRAIKIHKNAGEMTSVHEFGHALGLAHQANATKSFMSYANDAYVTDDDLERLVEGYR